MQDHDDLDNYYVDFEDDDDDALGTPTAGAGKKRKEPDSGLGIDHEVTVQKRARVPNVKLDDDRLLGPMGIPKLRARAAGLKLKGKGHEFSDAARLLSLYQLWLDDLFPKARFLDALKMVEKAGHKKRLQAARQEWIGQGAAARRDEGAEHTLAGAGAAADRPGPTPTTPRRDRDVVDVPDDEDLYDATPRAGRIAAPSTVTARSAADGGEPDEDDLEALMAEAEIADAQQTGSRGEDDLDALIAEAEAQEGPRTQGAAGVVPQERDEYADDEDAMREMEGW